MTEFLPDKLGTTRSPANDDSVKTGHSSRRGLLEILEWVQFCNLYGNTLSRVALMHSRSARLSNFFFGVPG